MQYYPELVKQITRSQACERIHNGMDAELQPGLVNRQFRLVS